MLNYSPALSLAETGKRVVRPSSWVCFSVPRPIQFGQAFSFVFLDLTDFLLRIAPVNTSSHISIILAEIES